MTRKQNSAKPKWKEVMAADADFMKALIQEVVQQVLEAEMDEAVGAEKGQRTASRSGLPVGILHARVNDPRRNPPCTAKGFVNVETLDVLERKRRQESSEKKVERSRDRRRC